MSAALVLQQLQARSAGGQPERRVQPDRRVQPIEATTGAEVAFYRKYTEGMLRRYMYRSMEIGRVPSLLGDFSFRGRSSSGRMYTFEDSIVFVHDVERCLTLLNPLERDLVGRIALQEYTQGEAAEQLGMSVRTVVRRYADALDRLTHVFLRRKLMQVPRAY